MPRSVKRTLTGYSLLPNSHYSTSVFPHHHYSLNLFLPFLTNTHVTSDHYPILTSINVHLNPPPPPATFTYRRINAIDYPKFIDDYHFIPLITNPPSCLPDLLDLFFAILRSLLDHHASIITKPNKSSRTDRTSSIILEILSIKSAGRSLKRTYIASTFYFLPEIVSVFY